MRKARGIEIRSMVHTLSPGEHPLFSFPLEFSPPVCKHTDIEDDYTAHTQKQVEQDDVACQCQQKAPQLLPATRGRSFVGGLPPALQGSQPHCQSDESRTSAASSRRAV